MSPLARLLDFLAAKYDIVFLVSAGNVPDQPTIVRRPDGAGAVNCAGMSSRANVDGAAA